MTLPFDNDTHRVEQKIAYHSLAANKQRNFLSGIIIFAAALLLSFATILLCNATIDTQIISRVNNVQEMVGVIFGIAVVLLFTAGIAIKNIMYISVLQRTKEFAQLRTIGATYRQIKAIIHNERKQLSRKFIWGGLLLGFLLNCVLPLKLYLMPGIACAIFSGAFVWFIVFWSFRTPVKIAASFSPMAALRVEQTTGKGSRRSKHITPNAIAQKYFFSNRKKAFYTLLSLILSGVLMFTVFSVTSAIDIEGLVRQSYYENSSVYLMLNSTAEKNSTANLMKNSPFTEELREEIEAIPGVTGIYPSKKLDCEITVPDQSISTQFDMALNSIIGTSSFEGQLVEGTMPYSQNTITTVPVIINRSSPYYKETGLDLKLGDHLSASVHTGQSMKQMDFSVCGFIENKDKGSVLYTAPEYLDYMAEMNCDLAWYICTDSQRDTVAVEQIKVLVASDNRLIASAFSDDFAETNAYLHNAKIVVVAVLMLICLFSFINLLNTCITNAVMRHHDYALLEAAGMTKEQIQQTQSSENRIYFSGGLIGSCMIGIPLGLLLCKKIAELPGLSYISYQFPWVFLLLYFVIVFAANIIVTQYQRNFLTKHSVIEQLKAVE